MNLGAAQTIGDPQPTQCIPSQVQELILADFFVEPDIAETINELLSEQQPQSEEPVAFVPCRAGASRHSVHF